MDPFWVAALARQESAFRDDVCSPSGACGMMQMKPATARAMEKLGPPLPADTKRDEEGRVDLSDKVASITLGVRFLRRLEQRLDGDPLRALAGYNAGPNAAARWEGGSIPSDLAFELIPDLRAQAYALGILVRYHLYSVWLNRGRIRTLVVQPSFVE